MDIAIVKKKIKCFLLHPNHSELFVCYLLKEHYTFQLCPVTYPLFMTPLLYETTDEKLPRNMTFQHMFHLLQFTVINVILAIQYVKSRVFLLSY